MTEEIPYFPPEEEQEPGWCAPEIDYPSDIDDDAMGLEYPADFGLGDAVDWV